MACRYVSKGSETQESLLVNGKDNLAFELGNMLGL
jgi:hypothetical protein